MLDGALRASVGSTEASESLVARVGVVGPTRAKSDGPNASHLAVQLLWHVLAPRPPARRRDGTLPRWRLRAIVEYDADLTLERLAAAARLSVYHFARQCKAATGLPPHQHVIARRVERAKLLLQGDLSLAEVAAHRLLGPEPVLPSLQAHSRRHARAIPDARKNRLTRSKPRQETPERSPYHSS